MVTQRMLWSLESLITEYVVQNPRSQELFARAQESLPGGNTRTGLYMAPFPVYAERGEGPYLITVDGHRLLDFLNNNSSLILGHAHPAVVKAIQEQAAKGTGFARPTPLELDLAELLQERVPSLERLRFCNSGSEAVLNALRTAKAFTGKRKIAKFEGAYHGSHDYAMVSSGPPVGPALGPADRPRSVASSAGLSEALVEEVVVLPFNDLAACEQIINEQADDLAAVIVDPLPVTLGTPLPVDGFLTRLRELTRRAGVLLVFDEVVSFRVSRGGAQELYGVRPDLTCLGKVIAGGTAGAAFGGRADIMALYDPTKGAKIPQSGTFNANPLSMVAGLATLRMLTPEAYVKLSALTQRLKAGLAEVFREAEVPASVIAVGSLFRVHFMAHPPRNYREFATQDDKAMQRKLLFWLLNHGILFGWNVSLAMENEHVDHLVSSVRTALQEL